MGVQNAQLFSRIHWKNEVNVRRLDGISQTLHSNHHHKLLTFPVCVNAENLIKQTIVQVRETQQYVSIKLMTVSYPENFLRAGRNYLNTSAIQSDAKTWNPQRMRRRRKKLASPPNVRNTLKTTIDWESPVIQRNHCFVFNVCLSWRSQMHRSKPTLWPSSLICKTE